MILGVEHLMEEIKKKEKGKLLKILETFAKKGKSIFCRRKENFSFQFL